MKYDTGHCWLQSGLMPKVLARLHDSLERSEVPPSVESGHQRNKACPKSRMVPRLEEPTSLVERDLYYFLLV